MFFSSKRVIGLDIGTSSIKMAEMEVSKSGATLLSFVLAPTPTNSVSTGEISNPNMVGGVISGMFSELRSKRKYVSTGLWGTAVIVKKITIPKMEKKLIRDQIRFEAEQYIPFDVNNISLDYFLLSNSNSPDTLDVLLVAAQNEVVNQYVSTITNAALKIAVIDVSGFALANTFEMNYGRFRNENIGVFNFGSSVTNFVVISHGQVIFCRDIPVGGSNYTNEISKNLGVSLIEAESLKISASLRREVPEEVHSIIGSTSEAVIEEIKNSLDFLSATTNGLTLNRCFYTGGGAATSGMIDSMIKSTGLGFEPMNCFRKIKYSSKKISPAYLQQIGNYSSVALGLAARQDGDND
ncbi:MAG: type IV pilus assembly protein PilM [Bdellovibrionota bacterium]